MSQVTLTNGRASRAANAVKRGGKSYFKQVKANTKNTVKDAALIGGGAALGNALAGFVAMKAGAGEADPEVRARTQAIASVSVRAGSVVAGLLMTPFAPTVGVGLAAVGLIGLVRKGLGFVPGAKATLANAEGASIEADYGVEDIDSMDIDQAVQGLRSVGTPTLPPRSRLREVA